MIPYSFHPEAEAEFADAAVFYESRLIGLGKSFVAEVERTVSLTREHPDIDVYLGAIDDRLTTEEDAFPAGYIMPGLGDAGDRQFGT